MPGERNFHIFYMIMNSGDQQLLQHLGVHNLSADDFHYTSQGNASIVKTINDKNDYRQLLDAFKSLAFSVGEVKVR